MSRTVNKKMRKKSAPGADYALGILKRCAKVKRVPLTISCLCLHITLSMCLMHSVW